MLAIRMQRTGRKKHAMFRVVVQDSRLTPTSGKVVAYLGSYDPHAKTATIDGEKASFYLDHGAHPSERVAVLLQKEGVKLPKWVEVTTKKQGKLKNPDKLRRNRPDEPVEAEAPAAAVTEATEVASEEATAEPAEAPAETVEAEAPAAEAPAEEATTEATDEAAPAEESPSQS